VTEIASHVPRGEHHDVVVLRWPEQALDVDRLDALGIPRLLLVDPGASPPQTSSCLQDWIRLPADDADVRARIENLSRRPSWHPSLPRVDDVGQLSYRGLALFLSPLDERLARVLIEHFGELVPEEALLEHGWPRGTTVQAARTQVSRMRRRIAPLGLCITRARGNGYVMHHRTIGAATRRKLTPTEADPEP
jgi:hypothetical protein